MAKEQIIDDKILNTSPKDPNQAKQQLPASKEIKTFLDLNKPTIQQPKNDVILNLDGTDQVIAQKGVPVSEDGKLPADILGVDSQKEPILTPGIIMLVSAFIFIVIIVIAVSQKSAMHIAHLESELDNIKKGKINSLN